MNLNELARALGWSLLTPEVALDGGPEVARAHASDLLSDVLANAPAEGLLLTIQVHLNVIAVALHAGLKAVVFTSGLVPDEAVRARAVAEGLPLFATEEATFDVAGKLYALGLRGRHG